MSDRPNLFEFAPRELSHSAFWAWVLDSLDTTGEEFGDIRELGDVLLDSAGASPPEENITVNREHSLAGDAGRVDIYAIIDDNEAIVIENKVSDRPSVDQLQRYRDGTEAEESHFLLISTAYPREDARRIEAEEDWTYLNAGDLLGLLEKVDADHPVIADYHLWLADILQRRKVKERKARASDPDTRAEGLGTAPGQWAFMKEVTEPFAETGRQYAHRDTTGGDPWTEFRFVEETTDQQDAIYYRVEKLAAGPTFRICQYQGTVSPDLDTKKDRLDDLRDLWFETVDNNGKLPWDQKNTGGKNRCEIARINLTEYGADELANELAQVHGPFVERLRHRGVEVEETWRPERW